MGTDPVQVYGNQGEVGGRDGTTPASFGKELEKVTSQQNTTAVKISDIFETTADKFNIQVLANLASSMASSNLALNSQNLSARVANEMGLELDLLVQPNPTLTDAVSINDRNACSPERKTEAREKDKEKGRSSKDASSSKETSSIVKEYSAAYAAYVVGGSAEARRKMEKLEEQLGGKGIADDKLRLIKDSIDSSIQTDISKAIKEAFLKSMLIQSKSLESIMARKNLTDALDLARSRGWGPGDLEELAMEQADEARAEAKDFLLEELELELISEILSGNIKGAKGKLRSLLILALKLGVKVDSFLERWKKKLSDLGLAAFDPKLAAQLGMDSGKKDERESRYDMTEEDENEILINRLRALYMRRALKNDIITKLDTAFKMRKLKNGLIKLGLKIDDFERVEKEGVLLAKGKLLEMLKEALAERATLYDLAGPAFKLIERKIKGVMNNLERIGKALTVFEFENLRDGENRKIYDIAVQELHSVDGALSSMSDPALERRRGQLAKLIARLRAESNIESVDIDPAKEELIRHGIEGRKIVRERA